MTLLGGDQEARRGRGYWVSIRRYFLTGLIITLPTFLTFYVLWFLWGVMDALLFPITHTVLRPFVTRETVPIVVTMLSAITAAALVWLVGFTSAAFSRRLFERAEAAIERVPVVRGIQQTVKQLVRLFVATDSSFKQVAVIEYPRRGLYCLCFVTSSARWTLPGEPPRRAVSVFIPTTPNPTSGFFILVPEQDVTPLDISVDEAVKVIISGGLVSPAGNGLTAERVPLDPSPR